MTTAQLQPAFSLAAPAPSHLSNCRFLPRQDVAQARAHAASALGCTVGHAKPGFDARGDCVAPTRGANRSSPRGQFSFGPAQKPRAIFEFRAPAPRPEALARPAAPRPDGSTCDRRRSGDGRCRHSPGRSAFRLGGLLRRPGGSAAARPAGRWRSSISRCFGLMTDLVQDDRELIPRLRGVVGGGLPLRVRAFLDVAVLHHCVGPRRIWYQNPMIVLPEGHYPFIDERLPLSEMTMVEAPARLEALFKEEAAKSGVPIIRDEPVELRCRSDEYPDATFLIYWPRGTDRIHMLVPTRFAVGRA